MKLRKYYLLLIFLIILVAYWGALLRPISIGSDLDYYFKGTLKDLINLPLTWREFFVGDGLGEYTISNIWTWPVVFSSALFSSLGFEYSLIIKLLFLLPIILFNFFGIKKLTDFYGIKSWPQIISILFYSLNTYILLLIDGGQIGLALAYGVLPLAYVSIKKYIEETTAKRIGISIFFTTILSFFDLRIIFFLAALIVLDLIFVIFVRKQTRKLSSYLKMGFFTIIFLIGIHAYWLLPVFISKPPQLPVNYSRESQVESLSFATIAHSFYMVQPHWFENKFGQIKPISIEFIFIPMLVFLSVILKKRDPDIGFWLLVAFVSIFLIKGSNEPLPSVYGWLFQNIPGFSVFRDPTKFFFTLALSCAILIGISVSEITQRLTRLPKIKSVFIISCMGYLIFMARPIWLDKMTGLFSEPTNKNNYLQLANILSKDTSFSRIVWIPRKPSLGYTSFDHPALNALTLAQKRPFAVGTKGAYETLNFLREASFSGQLLDVSGVGYVGYPPLDPRKDDMHTDNIRYYYIFLNQLSKLPWFLRVENSPVPLFMITKHQDRFFATPNLWWVIGSDYIYNEAVKDSRLNLSKNALIFAEEFGGLGAKLDELPEAKIVLYQKAILDFAATFIPKQQLIFPARNLNFAPDKTGWWKREASDLINWRDFLQTKYGIDNQDFGLGGGWAVGEGSLKLKVQSETLKKDKLLLARVMESSKSGSLKFYQGDNLIGQVVTRIDSQQTNVRWFEVGKLNSDEELTVVSEGDINVVNALAVVERDEWLALETKAEGYKENSRIVEFNEKNTESSGEAVTYQRINSTKYKVHISGLKKPGFLVFSENYDDLWKMDGRSALPVYSLLNGFRIEKDGDYLIEFKPQKYVTLGLLISGSTVFTGTFFVFAYSIMKKKKGN